MQLLFSVIFAFFILLDPPLISSSRHLTSLVPPTPIVLPYHGGPLLTGDSRSTLRVNLLWYGSFSPAQRSVVTDFFRSFGDRRFRRAPSVSSWWSVVSSYVDKNKTTVAKVIKLGKQVSDADYSMGKSLKRSDMKKLILRAINDNSLPSPSSYGSESVATLYFVLTASDVVVERFCMNSCGFHDSTVTSVNPRISHHSSLSMPYAWVGNPATQCPGLCAWPFAKPEYGPPTPPLLPPNQDIGMDGMMINIATILAGAATNPFNSGYFQGDPSAPLEASTACVGSFGPGSYPGYPGNLQADKRTKASYNVIGANRREYLLPAVWSPLTETCKPPQS